MKIVKEENTGMGKMKRYTFKINKFWKSEEIMIIAKDKETAFNIAKGIVATQNK